MRTQLAAEWARFALDRSPYDENLLRDADRAVPLRRGDRAGATQLYNSAAERFRADLGVTNVVRPRHAWDDRSPRSSSIVIHLDRFTEREVDLDDLIPRARGHAECVRSTASRHLRCAAPLPRSTAVRGTEIAGRDSRPPSVATSRRSMPAPTTLKRTPDSPARSVPGGHVHRLPGQRRRVAPRAVLTRPGRYRLDPLLGEAHTVLAHVTLCQDYDWTLAEQLCTVRRSRWTPCRSSRRTSYALDYLTAVGRSDEALATSRSRPRRRSPTFPPISRHVRDELRVQPAGSELAPPRV